MSDTKFDNDSPKSGSRVEVVYGVPPRPYVVKTWVNGQLVDERAFDRKDEAEKYQLRQAKRPK